MPLTWTIDHKAKTIVATAAGAMTHQEVMSYLDGLVAEGAVGYRAIFDARRAAGLNIRSAELAAQGRLVASRKPDGFDGAIALIVTSEAEREMADYFSEFLSGARPCRIFHDIEAARAWYAELDAASRG
ncbi:MAG: hypothetical protein KF889_27585 [Alphaproteobacteria bacterium]|nr:hypothetical protein [Alphaproteobacteria bacterium]MCW5743717.1 hypothetical protein [Alphaproteobacteria bacterium]